MYLNGAYCSIIVLLLIRISGFRPLRVNCDGDNSILFGPVLVIVNMPGLSVSFKQVVTNNVGQSTWSETDPWRQTDTFAASLYFLLLRVWSRIALLFLQKTYCLMFETVHFVLNNFGVLIYSFACSVTVLFLFVK